MTTITAIENAIFMSTEALDHLATLSVHTDLTTTDAAHLKSMASILELMSNTLLEESLNLPESAESVRDLIDTIERTSTSVKSCFA
jgi:hypothetical protein